MNSSCETAVNGVTICTNRRPLDAAKEERCISYKKKKKLMKITAPLSIETQHTMRTCV